jgi:hypothetical protein
LHVDDPNPLRNRWTASAYGVAGTLAISLAAVVWPLMADGMIGRSGYTDGFRQGYFWRVFYQHAIANGELPLWYPNIFMGIPYLGNPLSAAFYPFSTLFLLLPVEGAYKAFLILHLALAGLFMFVMARRFGLARAAALVAALAYMLNANFIGYAYGGLHAELSTLIWMPLALWAYDHVLKASARRMLWIAALSVIIALQILAGHPQRLFFSVMVLLLYGGWIAWNAERRAAVAVKAGGLLAVAGAFAALLAAVQVVPSWEAMQMSNRAPPMASGLSLDSPTLMGSLHPIRLVTLVVPDVFGNPVSLGPVRTDWLSAAMGDVHTLELQAYLGIAPLVFALFAFRHPLGPTTRFFRILVVVALVLAIGKYLLVYPLLLWSMPPLQIFRVPARFLSVVVFALAFLAGCGLQVFLDERGDSIRNSCRRWGRGLAVVAGSLVMAAIIGVVLRPVVHEFGNDILIYLYEVKHRARRLPLAVWQSLVDPAYRLALYGIVSAGCLFGAVAWLFLRRSAMALPPSWMPAAVVLLVAADLVPFGRKYMVTDDIGQDLVRSAEILSPIAQSDGSAYRILPYYAPSSDYVGSLLSPSDNAVVAFGLFSFGGYESYEFSQHAALADGLSQQLQSGATTLLDTLSIRWILSRDSISSPAIRLVKDGPIKVFENPNALPRAWICYSFHLVGNEEHALAALVRGDVDPHDAVVVTEDMPGLDRLTPGGGPCEPATLAGSEPNAVKLDVYARRIGIVVVSDMYVPGWKAYVDGVEARPGRANYSLKGVVVPEGVHDVQFRYEPASVRIGALLSLTGSCVLGLVAVIGNLGMLRRRRQASVRTRG